MKSIPALLSCQNLKALLKFSPKKISVLETDIGKQYQTEFQHAHIPTARYFDQLECTTPTKFIPRGLPDIQCFESYVSNLGVSDSDHIVLYDRSPMGIYASTRAWWLFRLLGVESLSVLNGGFSKWLKEINETESSINIQKVDDQIQRGKFTVKLNKQMIRNYDEMLKLVSTKHANQQIVDARPSKLFNGADAGHLPNSLNLPYNTVFDQENQVLKSPEDLQKLFKQANIDLSKPTVYTCQTGTTASTLAFIAHILGQQSISVYNGSFTEWQQRAPKELVHNDNNKANSAA